MSVKLTKKVKKNTSKKSVMTLKELGEILDAGTPKLPEHKELVKKIKVLVAKFTKDVKTAAENSGAGEVDVIIQISPKNNLSKE